MDTRKIASELRLSQWAGILRERKESGLSVQRWCLENDVQEKTYYYWQRKLRENVCDKLTQETGTAMTPAFAQINLPKECGCAGSVVSVKHPSAHCQGGNRQSTHRSD